MHTHSNAGVVTPVETEEGAKSAMSMREAYVFAAKAAGVKFKWEEHDTLSYFPADTRTQVTWDPGYDGRVTIELIAKLKLMVDVDGDGITVVAPASSGLDNCVRHYPPSERTEASVRAAVLRLAADIGKAMP